MEQTQQRGTEDPESGEPVVELQQGVVPQPDVQYRVYDRERVDAELERP